MPYNSSLPNGFEGIESISRRDSSVAVCMLSGLCNSFGWLQASSHILTTWTAVAFYMSSLCQAGWALRREKKGISGIFKTEKKIFLKISISTIRLTGAVWVQELLFAFQMCYTREVPLPADWLEKYGLHFKNSSLSFCLHSFFFLSYFYFIHTPFLYTILKIVCFFPRLKHCC